ncbi:hypothetical protein [Paludisphaera mucosa]|uniref:HEAT repeat domain-containing protein n=1 Tax=Paludisphaera mucosa TaxID=3030827 RepID=A0ABT6F4W6_9BACT|nr:hypothetical protein [Paludisphaera mucosa]MDG3002546.1 hypothetical protein [Paludisphaera mucosa]
MKRTFAIVVLLAALGVAAKLAVKPPGGPARPGAPAEAPAGVATAPTISDEDALVARYRDASAEDRALVARTLERYRRNAVAVERSDGLRGLALLDRLDLEALFLHEKHPTEFRRLRDLLGDDAAADLLLHWREYFGLKRADETDRKILIAELEGLSPEQRRLAAKHPNALPLILAEPAGVAELMASAGDDDPTLVDRLVVLSLVSLESGAADLRAALRTLEDHPTLAVDAFRLHGMEGFALVSLYGPVLESLGSAMPLDESLILLRVNTDFVDEQLQTHRPETIARHLAHVKAAGLVKEVGGGPNALRLAVEYGEVGERALAKAGADAADVVYDDFTDPVLRRQAAVALGDHGAMALAMLEKYATDPDFREILRAHGGAVVPPIARADAGPETLAYLQSKERPSFTENLAKTALYLSGDDGQSVIRTIRKDGLARVASLGDSELRFYQFLPLYDMIHLGDVVRRGYAPTTGEAAWALLDACFVVTDVLSLAAIQPGAAVAVEAARSELKAAVRESSRSAGREAVETGVEAAAKAAARESGDLAARRAARWWTVRAAGGVYQVLRRTPEALQRMTLGQLADVARPLCAKAGLRLSSWAPFRLLRDGAEVAFQIPPERGLKYLGAQLAQATVGVVGFHKMEEHLASRRPQPAVESQPLQLIR